MTNVGDQVEISNQAHGWSETYQIIGGEWDRLLVSPPDSNLEIVIFFDGRWNSEIPNGEVKFLSPEFKKWKPSYPIGTILVISSFTGRSTGYRFCKLKKRRPSGNYIADCLEVEREEIYSDPGQSKHQLVLTDNINGQADLRWYPSQTAFSPEKVHGYMSVSNSIYDPNKEYFSQWLSD